MQWLADNEWVCYAVAIFLLLLISAFFSAAETALTAISRARIYQLVMDGNRRAQAVSRLRREKESLIGAVLLGNNAVTIAASAMATAATIKLVGDGKELLAVTLVMTLVVVVFTEILPKTYAIQNAERVSLALAGILSAFVRVVTPLTFLIQRFGRLLFALFGIDISKTNSMVSTTDILRGTIELHHREGKMIKQDRDMLGSILDLNDIEVCDIMAHRKEVETINADLPAEEIIRQAVSTTHSRIPLWRGEQDNIIGLLHIKTLIRTLNARKGELLTSEDILAICVAPWFIPETTTLRDQLLAFRSKRSHFAFVVDEYGGWKGVVTLEDIIEEIVGDIDDEHSGEDSGIQQVNDTNFIVRGNVNLRDLNRQLDWKLPDEHASTVAGLLIYEAQTLPAVGESFNVHGFVFTVLESDGVRIMRLRIEAPEAGFWDQVGL